MRLVNGVFMGGGAKSIAYAGALGATRERGLWFGGVAGSSAGAIVASLIAAGMQPEALEAAIPDGLRAVQSPKIRRFGKAVLGQVTSLYEGRGLRTWLDHMLSEQIGKREGGPVTFAELHAATGIELYVLSVDLSNGLPVVFCRRTTPSVEVAGAVAASAAIPGAFPAGRAVFDAPGDGAVVHQLIDGSSWANLPVFVFHDRAFRAWLRGESQSGGEWSAAEELNWEHEEARPVLGYILGDPEPLEHRNSVGFVPLDRADINRRFDQGPTYTSPKPATYLFGSLLSSDWVRLAVGVALIMWVALSVVVAPVAFRRFSTWMALWIPDFLYPVAVIGSLSVLVVAMIVAIVAIAGMIVVGRLVADTVLPSLKAVLGVPLEVPPWTGLGEDSVVLRVPHPGLHTVEFGVDLATRTAAIATARQSVGRQLDDEVVRARLDALFAGTDPVIVPYRRGHRTPDVAASTDRASWWEVVALVGAAGLVGVVGWWAANSAGADWIGRIVLGVVLALVAVGVAIWYVGGRAARRAAARAAYGVGVSGRGQEQVSIAMIVAGVGLVIVGALMSQAAMNDRSPGGGQLPNTVGAQVVTAESSPPGKLNTYEMVIDGGRTVEVMTDRHLRLGERAFVRLGADGESGRLVGALDDGRFAISMILWILGLGLVVSGIRTHRWAVRCRRLEALVIDWRAG